MTSATPKLQIPYVEPDDHPNVYPAADQAQAERLEVVIGEADTGWITGSGSDLFVPNATNLTLTTIRLRLSGHQVSIYLTGTMKVASGAPGSTGDISNITLGQFVAAYRPAGGPPPQALITGPWGRPLVPFVDGTGNLLIGAIGGTTPLAVGEAISIAGTYLL